MKISIYRPLALVIFLISFFSVELSAQFVKIDSTSNWKKRFRVGMNINQASFSSNWKAGGVNSLGFNTLLNYQANYKKDKNSWDNSIDLLYGMVNNEGQGYRKTMDRIYLDTKYGRSMNEKWDMFLSANFLSQFAKGYSYSKDINGLEVATLISDIFAPAFVTTAWGMEYHPVDYFKVRLAPFAPRVTIVKDVDRFVTVDNPTPYGVNPGENARYEWLAFQMLAEFNKDIAPNVNLKWRYVMFANYETLELNKIDHRLEVAFSAKVTKFINVSLGSILIYDFDQDLGAQVSQAFSLGMLYSIQNFEEKK
jgi:hypothetical protein